MNLTCNNFSLNTKNLFKNVISSQKLQEAWHQIKNNSENEILDNVNESWFGNTSQALINGRFKYSYARKINMIDPLNKKSFTILNITNSRIKIIEKTLLNHLEFIFEGAYNWNAISEKEFKTAEINFDAATLKREYKVVVSKKTNKNVYKKKHHIAEKIFKPTSFGFRKNKSVHLALHHIKTKWTSDIKYFLDYDIEKIFESINRNKLKNTFNKYVKDPRIWEEIEKMLNAGYILDNTLQINDITTDFNSSLSLFLLNVYMHNLDQFIENLNRKYNKNKRFCESIGYGNIEANKSYRKLVSKYSNKTLKTYQNLDSQERFLAKKKKDFLGHAINYDKNNEIKTTKQFIQYVRYSNETIIGITSSKAFAVYVRKEIDTFLKSNLHFKINKNKIVDKYQPSIIFLNHTIQLVNYNDKIRSKNKQLEAIHRYKKRAIQKQKSKENRIIKLKTSKFKNEMLKHLYIMLKELNLTNVQEKEFNILSSLSTYKFLGNVLAQNLKLNGIKELVNSLSLLNNSKELKNPTLKKFYNTLDQNIKHDQGIALLNINNEITNLKHSNDYKIKKIGPMLKKTQNIIEAKTKKLLDTAVIKLVLEKSRQIREIHLRKQMKNKRSKTVSSPSVEEEKPFKTQNRLVNIISVKANIEKLKKKLKLAGFMHSTRNKAQACPKLITVSEDKIIEHYDSVIRQILSWFSGSDNFFKVKGIMESIMRQSCLLTLKKKYRLKNIAEAKK